MGMVDIQGVQELIGDLLVSGYDDDVGEDDDVSGDYDDYTGGYEEIGRRGKKRKKALARRPSSNIQRAAMANALASRRVQGGAVVKEHAYTKARQWILGLDSVTNVGAGATGSITSNPQMPFKPRRLSVWGSVASSFLLSSLVIGNQPQFASLQFAVPADMFGPTAFGTDLNCDTAQANTNVQIQATNVSGAGLRFVAGIVGEAVA